MEGSSVMYRIIKQGGRFKGKKTYTTGELRRKQIKKIENKGVSSVKEHTQDDMSQTECCVSPQWYPQQQQHRQNFVWMSAWQQKE